MTKRLEIIAGPNGTGKTTLSEYLLEAGKLENLINADIIAKGLDASNQKGGEITAGKIMLDQLNDALENGKNVSFETTLSGKLWVKLISKAKELSYQISIYYVIVSDPEICIARIAERVSKGGHYIPRETVLRRYSRSKDLLCNVYSALADNLYIFDNSNGNAYLIAKKTETSSLQILNDVEFAKIFGEEK